MHLIDQSCPDCVILCDRWPPNTRRSIETSSYGSKAKRGVSVHHEDLGGSQNITGAALLGWRIWSPPDCFQY